MARPRVFVSSTYYDLKHIRSSLDMFVESLGYDPVLSEKGDIAYTPDRPLDESCYREAQNADLFVLIIGGRYGSDSSTSNSSKESKKPTHSFFDRYDSITKKEYESAVTRDIPIYIFIESGVYSEYQTFLRNKGNSEIKYAHVDSVNIFLLIEEILARPRNNAVRAFERFSEIETWLRDQWAGLFRELLAKQSQQQQLLALTTEIGELKGINETLKKYLEAMMTGVSPDVSARLIASEDKRLDALRRLDRLRMSKWFKHVSSQYEISLEQFMEVLRKADSYRSFADQLGKVVDSDSARLDTLGILERHKAARADLNEARSIFGLPEIKEDDVSEEPSESASRKGRRKKRSVPDVESV